MIVGECVEVLVKHLSIRPRWMPGVVREVHVSAGRTRVVVEVTEWLRVSIWADSPRLRLPAREVEAA